MQLQPNGQANKPGLLRLGISRCLLGDAVRFDSGHKRDRFLTDVLSRYVEWISVCPEVEAGLGVPREPIRLVHRGGPPAVMTVRTQVDLTATMQRFSDRRVRELAALNLCGYVFKKDSPSCGMERVRVYHDSSSRMPSRNGIGVFARAFMAHFPQTPVEEEGRLNDAAIRTNFLERIVCYQRWQDFLSTRITCQELIRFHTRHKLLLLSYSREHYQQLGRLIADARAYSIADLVEVYGRGLMQALRRRATIRKHADVLHHIVGYFRRILDQDGKKELLEVIDDYRHGLVPLTAPLTLINHYVRRYKVEYLQEQVYLNRHPLELMGQ